MEKINDIVYPETCVFPKNIERSVIILVCDIRSSTDKTVNIGSDLNDK